MAGAIITFAGVAHPWMCDQMGHMNVRNYVAMFDDASFQLLGHVAAPDPGSGLGWADVRLEIDYKHETSAGTLLTVRSQVVRLGGSSLTYEHSMTGSLDNVVHARARVVSVRFDLAARRKIELTPAERESALKLTASPDIG